MLDLPLHLVANERPLINIDGTLFLNILLCISLTWFFIHPCSWAAAVSIALPHCR